MSTNEQSSNPGVMTYADGSEAAMEAGKRVWAHLNRMETEEESYSRALGAFGPIGAVASLVTAGVNLALGGRNMKRKSSDTHNLSVTLNNFTPYTFIIRELINVDNAILKAPAVCAGETATIELGTRSYSGSANKDKGPVIVMTISDGSYQVSLEVKFIDSTADGYSGQIRLRMLSASGSGAEDLSGEKSNKDMKYPFYTYRSNDNRPSFMVTSSPVSSGDADVSVTIMA